MWEEELLQKAGEVNIVFSFYSTHMPGLLILLFYLLAMALRLAILWHY